MSESLVTAYLPRIQTQVEEKIAPIQTLTKTPFQQACVKFQGLAFPRIIGRNVTFPINRAKLAPLGKVSQEVEAIQSYLDHRVAPAQA